MEVVTNATTGKVRIILGGIVYNSCTDDLSCPGNAHCALNVSWADSPAMCTCSALYGFIGALCNQVGPQTQFVYALSGLTLVVACLTTLVGLVALYRNYLKVIHQKRHNILRSAALLSVLMNMIAAVLTTAAMASQIVAVTGFGEAPEIVTVNGRPEKSLPGQERIVILYVVTHITTMCTVFMLALSFLSIAKKAETLSTHRRSMYQQIVVLYVMGSLIVLIPMATQPVTWPALNIILFVITFIVGLIFLFGGLRLRALMRRTNANNSINLELAARRLYWTSFAVGGTCVLVTGLGAYSGLGVARTNTYQPPRYPLPREVCFRVSVLFLAVAQFLVSQYLLPRSLKSSSSATSDHKDKRTPKATEVSKVMNENTSYKQGISSGVIAHSSDHNSEGPAADATSLNASISTVMIQSWEKEPATAD